MEGKIKKLEKSFLQKGESPNMALVLAQTRYLTDEFKSLNREIVLIKRVLISNYGEVALKHMNDGE